MTEVFIVIIISYITININTIYIGYSCLIPINIVINSSYYHVVGEGGGGGADEDEGQQNGA